MKRKLREESDFGRKDTLDLAGDDSRGGIDFQRNDTLYRCQAFWQQNLTIKTVCLKKADTELWSVLDRKSDRLNLCFRKRELCFV